MDDQYIVIIDVEDKKNQIKYFSITNSKSAIKEKVFKYIKNIKDNHKIDKFTVNSEGQSIIVIRFKWNHNYYHFYLRLP